jgi:hypothetical protein
MPARSAERGRPRHVLDDEPRPLALLATAYGFSAFAAPGACTGKPIALYSFSLMRLMTVV